MVQHRVSNLTQKGSGSKDGGRISFEVMTSQKNLEVDETSDAIQLVRQAVLFDNVDLLCDLLKENPWVVDRVDRYGRTILMLAAQNGKLTVLQSLVLLMPDHIDFVNNQSKSALHLAVEAGKMNAVECLLSTGADATRRDASGHCALEAAHMAGNEPAANAIIQTIQMESEFLSKSHKELIAACKEGDAEKVDQIIGSVRERHRDALLNGERENDDTALFVASTNGQSEVVERLLGEKGHVLVRSNKDTVLHAAVSSQSVSVLLLLLQILRKLPAFAGFDHRSLVEFPALIANSNCDQSSCLHWAAQSGNLEVLKALLEHQYPDQLYKEIDMSRSASPYRFVMDVNQCDSQCRTALHLAVVNDHFDILNYILHFEVEFVRFGPGCPFHVDMYCSRGRTPLMQAAFSASTNIITLLLDHGADVNLPLAVLDEDLNNGEYRCVGSGPLIEATRADAVHVVHLLLDKGALDTDNRALRLAASSKNEKLIRMFLMRLVYPDTEYRVNKKNIDVGQMQLGQNLLPAALCPSRAATLNWSNAGLSLVGPELFMTAAVHVNPRLRSTRLALAALTRVDLSGNEMVVFPSSIFQMPSLRILNLEGNKMTTIDVPSHYVATTALEDLNMSKNGLKSITAQFLMSFPNLTQLDLSHNKITSLPDSIWSCPCLKGLDVSHNDLAVLPGIGRGGRSRGIPRLQPGLTQPDDLKDLQLEEPSNVTTLALTRLNVWQQNVKLKSDYDDAAPDTLGASCQLIALNLSHNNFQVYPMSVCCCAPRLTSLNLAHNQLSCLPSVQCLPANLRILDLSHNRIKESFAIASRVDLMCQAATPLQASMGGLRRQNSPQRNRSRSKSAVRSQRSLSVSRHGGKSDVSDEDMCMHKLHGSLEGLKTLNLAGNQLKEFKVLINDKVLSPVLGMLDLSENSLSAVDPAMARLSSLAVLNLTANKRLKELPPQLGLLSRLWSLSLKGCDLKEPLNSMVNIENCKTVEIVAHLKTILEESKTYHHLRIMILGDESVGKSVLWDGMKSEAVSKRQPYQCDTVRVADWRYETKKVKGEQHYGQIGFTTWDFIGQREYLATHAYLLPRRAIYLVVWRVTDGETAISNAVQWLVNIQARVPNASVILVGTHVDQVLSNASRFPAGYLEDIENKVRERVMIADADKRGLPRVLDLLFINGKAKNEIRILLNAIYKVACEVRIGKERVLDQQVPSSYVALLKVVRELVSDMRKTSTTPVLTMEQFGLKTSKILAAKFGRILKEDVDVRGGVSFLHEAGELVHFADASLRHLVFLCPLWLADSLAAVCALRSAKQPVGVLNTESMQAVYKLFKSQMKTSQVLYDLLHKCELAMLLGQQRVFLVPVLLPDEYHLRSDYSHASVRIGTKLAPWKIRFPGWTGHVATIAPSVSSAFRRPSVQSTAPSPVHRANGSSSAATADLREQDIMLTFAYNRDQIIRRVYSLAYVPAGFWNRIITRIIGDTNVCGALETLFAADSGEEAAAVGDVLRDILPSEWLVWQTGLEMLVKGHSVLVLKQFLPLAEVRDVDYSSVEVQYRDEQKRWRPAPLKNSTLIEIIIPSLCISASTGVDRLGIHTDLEGASRVMALVADLLDTLLEDWYPSLGTRFVHTSEGDLLVQRLVPCIGCAGVERKTQDDTQLARRRSSNAGVRGSRTTGEIKAIGVVHCFAVEECMLAAREYGWLECPSHGGVHMKSIAPDTVFMDMEQCLVIPGEQVRRGRMLGRGAFGFVFRATVKTHSGEFVEVAQKMLEPVDPGPSARVSEINAYKVAADKWRREALDFACRAYCTCRQELNLLCRTRHPNIIALQGVCVSPLSLVVELAPLGSLREQLNSHRKSGARLSWSVIREAAIQVAKALEYLHAAHIIYRDLKSENVLGWRFPSPFSSQSDVLLKLGDYGISRSVLPSGGAKGFGGTEGFMAPEIVRYNGEEEYTHKVDCFSYGMFLYELLTLKLPFEGEEHVKERLLDGARPVLLPTELLVPCGMLDLLVACWQGQPDQRPSSSQLVGFCSAPEFSHLLDVAAVEDGVVDALAVCMEDDEESDGDLTAQLWCLRSKGDLQVLTCTQYGWIEQKAVSTSIPVRFISKVRDSIWLSDLNGSVCVMSLNMAQVTHLQLPSLTAPLVRGPEVVSCWSEGSEVVLLASERELVLLRLVPESLSVTLVASMTLPWPCTCALYVPLLGDRQIWTGHEEGRISVHHLSQEDKFSFSSSMFLPDTEDSVSTLITSKHGEFVWVATKNGQKVYCMDVDHRQVSASLDIKKIMPESETIYTLDVEIVSDSRVSSICLLERLDGLQLYIATTGGVLIVASAFKCQAISACRPFSEGISRLCPIEPAPIDDAKCHGSISGASTESGLSWVRERVSETVDRLRPSGAVGFGPTATPASPVLAVVGQGYRSLTERFVNGERRRARELHAASLWRSADWA